MADPTHDPEQERAERILAATRLQLQEALADPTVAPSYRRLLRRRIRRLEAALSPAEVTS